MSCKWRCRCSNDLLDRHDETVALYLRKDDRACASRGQFSELYRQVLSYSRGLGYSGSLLRRERSCHLGAYRPGRTPASLPRKATASMRRLRRKLSEVSRDGFALSGGDLVVGAQAIARSSLRPGGAGDWLAGIVWTVGALSGKARKRMRKIGEGVGSDFVRGARLSGRELVQRRDKFAYGRVEFGRLLPMHESSGARICGASRKRFMPESTCG